MPAFQLSESFDVLTVASKLHRLHVLDHLWTDYLEGANAIPPADVDTLRKMAAEIDQIWRDLEEAVKQVAELVEPHGAEIQNAYDTFLAGNAVPDEHKRRIRETVERSGDVISFGKNALEAFVQAVPEARQDLAAQVQTLPRGKASGDMKADDCCKLGQTVAFVGAMLANPFIFGFGVGIMLACCPE